MQVNRATSLICWFKARLPEHLKFHRTPVKRSKSLFSFFISALSNYVPIIDISISYSCPFGYLHSVSTLLRIYYTFFFRFIKSSAAVAYPLKRFWRAVCSEMLLCTPPLLSPSCQLWPVCPSPLTYLINKVFFPAELLLTLSATNNKSTVKFTSITFLPHSDIWSEKQPNLLTVSACLYAFSCCHIIGWLNILIKKLVYNST